VHSFGMPMLAVRGPPMRRDPHGPHRSPPQFVFAQHPEADVKTLSFVMKNMVKSGSLAKVRLRQGGVGVMWTCMGETGWAPAPAHAADRLHPAGHGVRRSRRPTSWARRRRRPRCATCVDVHPSHPILLCVHDSIAATRLVPHSSMAGACTCLATRYHIARHPP
jgi:hypothetical protein